MVESIPNFLQSRHWQNFGRQTECWWRQLAKSLWGQRRNPTIQYCCYCVFCKFSANDVLSSNQCCSSKFGLTNKTGDIEFQGQSFLDIVSSWDVRSGIPRRPATCHLPRVFPKVDHHKVVCQTTSEPFLFLNHHHPSCPLPHQGQLQCTYALPTAFLVILLISSCI